MENEKYVMVFKLINSPNLELVEIYKSNKVTGERGSEFTIWLSSGGFATYSTNHYLYCMTDKPVGKYLDNK